jgi:hypothetical protein
MAEYLPGGPYVIQSGKRKGKSMELLMFHDYPFLDWWIGHMNKETRGSKSRLHQHLEWLMARGEDRKTRKTCPQCGKSPVEFFSSLGNDQFGYSIYPIYTCCGRTLCRLNLLSQAAGASPLFYPVKFSSIMNYRKKFDQEMVVKLLRAVYGLPSRLTAKIAFEFFSN